MKFTHPIKNSMGVGPSEARTTRKQRLRRFGNAGLAIENTTTIVGIPSADAFYVKDHWCVEASADVGTSVVVTTRFGARFTKRALFKGLIEKNIVKETSDWFAGYAEMLQNVVQENPVQRQKEKVDNSLLPVTELLRQIAASLDRTAYIGAGLLLLLTLVLALQLLVMRETIALIREEITALREEVSIVAARVKV